MEGKVNPALEFYQYDTYVYGVLYKHYFFRTGLLSDPPIRKLWISEAGFYSIMLKENEGESL